MLRSKLPEASVIRAFLVATMAIACGNSASATPTADSGVLADSGLSGDSEVPGDSGAGSDGAEGAADAGPSPKCPVGPGTITLDTGSGIIIQGITDDCYVIYQAATGEMSAIPIAGGTPIPLVASPARAMVVHNNVFIWSNLGLGAGESANLSGVGTLTLWSHAISTPTQLSTASIAFIASSSADSSAIAYTSDASTDGSTATLYGATTAALGSPVSLTSGIDTSGDIQSTGGTGYPVLRFTGTGSSAYALAGFRLAGETTDAGAISWFDIHAYRATTWAPQAIALLAQGFSLDKTGSYAAIALASGNLEVVPLAGGAAVPIDAAGTLSMWTPSYYLNTDDSFVLYATAVGSLKRSTANASAPQTLVPTLVNGIEAIAPNESWALVSNITGAGAFPYLPEDLSLASTTTAESPTALSTGAADAATTFTVPLGDAFSTDSSYAIFAAGVTYDENYNFVGTLNAASAANPSSIIPLATKTVRSAAVYGTSNGRNAYGRSDLALGGSKISFLDNFVAIGMSGRGTGTVDIHVIDLATSTTSAVLAQGTTPLYFVSPDKTVVVYVIDSGGSNDGLHAVAP